MSRQHIFLAAALGCAAVHVSGELHAQARGPALNERKESVETVVDPAAMRIEMETWLRRLVGKFRYEGSAHPSEDVVPIWGFMDCTGIGTGPGVQCVHNVMWPDDVQPHPSMSLYGMDPVTLKIRWLGVDYRGLPQGGEATLKNGVLRYVGPCVNEPVPACRGVVNIKAGADGEPVEIKSEMWIDYFADLTPMSASVLTLRRIDEIPAHR